jgi:hypothetical protein
MMTKQVLIVAAFVSLVLSLSGAFVLTQRGDDASSPTARTLQATAGSTPYGVFEGRIPCNGACERIKVRLTLFRNPADNAPTDYMLERIYVGRGNDRLMSRGRWQVLDVPIPDRYGVAYRLDEEAPADFSTYLPVGSDILLLLNPDMRPRVGDASHSFTLSRTH